MANDRPDNPEAHVMPGRYVNPTTNMSARAWATAGSDGDPVPAEEVWAKLESIPGLNKDLRQAEAELAAGGGVPFADEHCDCGQPGCTAWMVKEASGYVIHDEQEDEE